MTMTVALTCVLGLFVPAATQRDDSQLRAEVSGAEAEARAAADAAATALAERDAGEAELTRLKEKLARSEGWFTEAAVRRQSAVVRARVEETIATAARLRAAEAALEDSRRKLRVFLFEEASRLTMDADADARAGRSSEAAAKYARAVAALGEAARIPAPASADPWLGLDAEIPLTGHETAAELDAIAAAYRSVVERIDQILGTLAPQLAALSDAGSAWERLSRFRSVVDRAGGTSVDPRPALAELRASMARGEALRTRAVTNAEKVEALRARVDAVRGPDGVSP